MTFQFSSLIQINRFTVVFTWFKELCHALWGNVKVSDLTGMELIDLVMSI